MKHLVKTSLACIVAALVLVSCRYEPQDIGVKAQQLTEVQFEKYTLANGLDVVLHVDRSDPIVAIDLAVHVGSSRELPGRTGFAHLFEHLLFLDSENLGFGGLDSMNTRIGGQGTNGFTTKDMTQYFQAVPKDALEKIIWAEADKIGYFINTVTTQVLDKEKEVVKNEKRLRVDNRPYGHRWYMIGKALYADDHPYNWQVIGSLEDLNAAKLEDVKNFYNKWYVPNNVTVTLTGNFDVAQAKIWIDKYFGEIPRGADIAPITPRASGITETKSLYYEDNFATVAEYAMVWPTVPQYHKDAYALDMLSTYLGHGKRAPFNEVMIDEDKLTSSVSMFINNSEIAGEFYILVDAKEGADIDGLTDGVAKAFARFEQNGISQTDLDMIKTAQEVAFYANLQGALNKAIQLGEYNMFTGDPGFINQDIRNIQAVTTADVVRVYETYIKNKPHIQTSIVPKGKPELALGGAKLADIVEEKIVQGAEKTAVEVEDKRDWLRTASSFDRTIEPAFGSAYSLPSPVIWKGGLANGLKLIGVENDETPLVYFSLHLDAGRNRGSVDKPAVAALTADMLEKGTTSMTTAEFEDALSALGASVSVGSGQTATVISGNTLARNFDATMGLVTDMLLNPRWDETEFELLVSEAVDAITADAGNPSSISTRIWPQILYPDTHMFHYTSSGPKDKLTTVTLDDLKAFHAKNYAPGSASFRVAGNISKAQVGKSLSGLASAWTTATPPAVNLPQAKIPEISKVYFYDVPGAKQSVLRFGYPALTAVDADYPKANAMNYLLGNIYTSKLMTELRVNKGYTYGIRSGFGVIKDRGTFTVRSSVRANVTLEATQLIRDILANYGPDFTEDDLVTMKSALIKGQALRTETLSAKLGMLDGIVAYGYPDDYMSKNAEMVKAMDLAEFKRVADAYLRPDAMYYFIVGDGKTQGERLKELGLGDPVMLNTDAKDK
ncbi:MAG: peptidase M16 [Robiginitomaculum sp.]|nr:MAG: peptidase M16 [Robiginitomaculum sp.]